MSDVVREVALRLLIRVLRVIWNNWYCDSLLGWLRRIFIMLYMLQSRVGVLVYNVMSRCESLLRGHGGFICIKIARLLVVPILTGITTPELIYY